MKNLLKTTSAFLFLALFSMSITSCEKDFCYECSSFDNGTSRGEAWEYCEGDNVNGQTITKSSIEFLVQVSEEGGADCKK
ncbi:MAG: hypothetical protein AB8F74_14875, partial [Saprospiraceae bacterium]